MYPVLVADPTRAGTAYAGFSTNTLYRTGDGAQTWQRAGAGLPPFASITAMALFPDASGLAWAGTQHHGIFRTAAGGP